MASHLHKPKPARITVGRVLLGILVIVVLILVGDWLAPRLPQAEAWIKSQGIFAPIYYTALVCLLNLFCLPLDALLIAAGAIFDLGEGFLTITVAIYVSQSVIFWVSRLFMRKRVARWTEKNKKLARIDRALQHSGIKLLLLIRMAPIPAAPVSYLMGASPMKFWQFSIANLGLVPVAFVSQYFGYAAAHATTTTHDPSHSFSLHDALVYGGFVLALVVVVLIGHTARKALQAAGAEEED
ncbi:MAG: VTT domain-containing protein [Verrucomicrobiota bacterium]